MGRGWFVLLAALAPALAAVAQAKVEGEQLEGATESGTVEPVELSPFGPAGTFSGDAALWWHNAEEGAVCEIAVPAPVGRWRLVLGQVLSWDYSIIQFAVDGAPLGRPVDFCSEREAERCFPREVVLGEVTVAASPLRLGLRIVGRNPKVLDIGNQHGCGIDYLRFAAPAGGETTPGAEPTEPAAVARPTAWWDEATRTFCVLAPGGVFEMAIPRPGTTSIAGCWHHDAGRYRLRAHPAATSQLWWPASMAPETKVALLAGTYDLSLVWELRADGERLIGQRRAFVPRLNGERLVGVDPWNKAGNAPRAATWLPVTPGADLPAELRPLIEAVAADEQAMGPLKAWVSANFRP